MHIVTHLSFFFVITFFVDFHTDTNLPYHSHESYKQILLALYFFQIGHAIQALAQILSLYLKRYGKYNTAQVLIAITTYLCVIFPLIFGIYVYRVYELNNFTKDKLPNNIEYWLILELIYF